MFVAGDAIVTNGDMASTINSEAIPMAQLAIVAIQAVWTGTPVGNFTVQTSCDVGSSAPGVVPGTGVVNWSTYTGSTQAAGGSSGNFTWRTAENLPDKWVRLVYTAASGSGTLVSVRFFGKG